MSQTALAPVKAANVAKPTRPPLTAARGNLLQRKCACGGSAEGKCEKCSEEGQTLQRRGTGSAPASIPPVVHDVLGSPGRPLDTHTRSFMESRFGHDFGGVRVHDDSRAADSARSVNAAAYTVGNHIAFDQGQYQPGTHAGRQLLAHELAHTVQQSGLRRSGRDVKLGGATESHLEREADAAAAAVVGAGHDAQSVGAHAPAASLPSRAHAPLLSRQPADSPTAAPAATPPTSIQSAEDPGVRKWEAVPESHPVFKLGVYEWSKPAPGDTKPKVRAFRLKIFPLSPKKGNVKKKWHEHAEAGALESTIDTSGTVLRAGQKQGRPYTDVLRSYWLQKVGWDKTTAPKNWEAAGGDAATTFEPKVKGQTCHIDHIVELQIGGSNIKENMQVLDGPENVESGRYTFDVLRKKAAEIRAEQPGLENVVLHYDNVDQPSYECQPCCGVEQKALEMPPGPGGAGRNDLVPYTIQAGGGRTQIYVPKQGPEGNKGQEVSIYKSDVAENVTAAELVPGMLLLVLDRKPDGKDTIEACIDTESCAGQKRKTTLPLYLKGEQGLVHFSVAKDTGRLTLMNTSPNIHFTYPYLSGGGRSVRALSGDAEGIIKSLNPDLSTGLTGKGTYKPGLSLLKGLEFGVEFGPDHFVVTTGLNEATLKSVLKPIPGAKMTEAQLTLKLHDEFIPSGNLAFEYAPGDKKLLDVSVIIEKSAGGGLRAKGNLNAYIPGVDKAEGNAVYEDGEWSAYAKVQKSQIDLPVVKSGEVWAGLDQNGPKGGGKLELEVPGGHEATVALTFRDKKWLLAGHGEFHIPHLEPVVIHLTYDFETRKLSGSGKTGFKFSGLKGEIEVHYSARGGDDKAHVWGKADLKIDKGRAKGYLKVEMSLAGKFSGEGFISYKLMEGLVASAGIEIDEHEKVKLKGDLEFPTYELFPPFKGESTLLDWGIGSNIPEAKVDGNALRAEMRVRAYVQFVVGPGLFEHAYISTVIDDLFAEKPDLDVKLGGQLRVPASFTLGGEVSGALVLDLFLIQAKGGLKVPLEGKLSGEAIAKHLVRYAQNKLTAEATFDMTTSLDFIVRLDAFVKVKSGFLWWTKESGQTWTLWEKKWNTGASLNLTLARPLTYSSDTSFKPPPVKLVALDLTRDKFLKLVRTLFIKSDPGIYDTNQTGFHQR